MVRKSSRKSGGAALVSSLVRAEEAAEHEILETPTMSRLAGGHDGEEDGAPDEDEEQADEEAEAEIERRLVEEALREQQSAENEREQRGIYNGEALKQLVLEWDVDQPLAWVQTLDTCVAPLEEVSVHDDLKREVAFYNNSVVSVRAAKARLQSLNVAYKRPADYFAEMLKSDAHMAKVKDKLIYEQKKIHAVEERKKSQAHRKVAKEVQAEKIKQRLQEKKDTLDAVKQWKKRRNQDKGGAIHDDDDQELDAIVSGSGKRKRDGADDRGGNSKKPRGQDINRKREAKDKRYGFGGKKRHAKSNTRDSTNDTSRFPGRQQRGPMGKSAGGRAGGKPGGRAGGKPGAGAGKAPKAKRAGKDQRSKQRGKR